MKIGVVSTCCVLKKAALYTFRQPTAYEQGFDVIDTTNHIAGSVTILYKELPSCMKVGDTINLLLSV